MKIIKLDFKTILIRKLFNTAGFYIKKESSMDLKSNAPIRILD